MALSLIAAAAAAIGAGAVLTGHRAATREAAAEAAYPPAGEILTVEGMRMHAVVAGTGSDLVLIHGASGSLRDFTFSLVPALTDRFRVIAVDRPGLGWSEMPENGESLAVQARLIRGVVERLGARHPLVLGHSYGGAVALSWALNAPDTLAGLVLLSTPSHRWDAGLPAFYRITGHPLGRALAVPLLTALVPRRVVTRKLAEVFAPQGIPEGYGRHFGPEMTLRRKVLRANARQRRALKAQIAAMQARYSQLGLPVEIVHGTADTTVGLSIHAARLERDLPEARLTTLDGIGHMPHHAALPQVTAAIDRAAARAGLR